MHPAYALHESLPGFGAHKDWFRDLIREHGAKDVLEIGAGANPTLGPDAVRELRLQSHTINDVSADELRKAPAGAKTLCADFAAPNLGIEDRFDFAFSRMVNEHVRDGHVYYGNIHRALKPGGVTAHVFSTLYSLPFVVNRLLPESLSAALLDIFARRDHHKDGKFRAYYSWSRGPSRRQFRRFESLGFDVLQYTGYFGHLYYKNRLQPLHWLEQRKSALLLRMPSAHLTAYASVVLRKKH